MGKRLTLPKQIKQQVGKVIDMQDAEKLAMLKEKATSIRISILNTIYHAGAGHIGGPLSVTDILTALYFDVMNVKPDQPNWEDRDRLVLSKGHSAVALYATMAHRGFFPVEELNTFDALDSRLQGHPDMALLPGVDMSSGSLGQGISAAVGMALGAKRRRKSFRIFCILGDGETQEGQVWEAADVAAKYKLDNLTAIIDDNKLQQYGWPSSDGRGREIPTKDHESRWKAFGWQVIEVDGHDFEQLLAAFRLKTAGKPKLIVASTVKGKGVSFMENQYVWHAKVPTKDELDRAVEELRKGCAVS